MRLADLGGGRDRRLADQRPERLADLHLDIAGQVVALSPGQDQPGEPERGVVEELRHVGDDALQLDQPGNREDAGVHRAINLGGVVQHVHVDQRALGARVDHHDVVGVPCPAYRRPQPPLPGQLRGEREVCVGELIVGREQVQAGRAGPPNRLGNIGRAGQDVIKRRRFRRLAPEEDERGVPLGVGVDHQDTPVQLG